MAAGWRGREVLLIVALYLACGVAAGFLAGLLGIGGGLVVVPLLMLIFSVQAVMSPDVAMHVAVATSLSCILFTAVSSARAHARRGSVSWHYVRGLAPGIVAGTLLGSFGARCISGFGLRAFFVVFLLCIATQMLLDLYPKASGRTPKAPALAGAGLLIGGVSSLVGLGGGSLTVPFLRWSGVDLHKAVGTSSAVGWFIAVAGTLGFVASGWGDPLLPDWSLGYVSVPATLGIACTSVFFAPVGARLSHALPVSSLRKVFAVFLYITAANMIWGMIH